MLTIILALMISAVLTLGLDYLIWKIKYEVDKQRSWKQLNDKLENEGKKRLDGKRN